VGSLWHEISFQRFKIEHRIPGRLKRNWTEQSINLVMRDFTEQTILYFCNSSHTYISSELLLYTTQFLWDQNIFVLILAWCPSTKSFSLTRKNGIVEIDSTEIGRISEF
jgi:hypothetical protein